MKAKFEFWRADGQGERVKYYEIELENVLVAHVSPSVGAGSILNENVGLKFSKVKWRYPRKRSAAALGATRPVAGTCLRTAMRNGAAILATLICVVTEGQAQRLDAPYVTGKMLVRK